MKKILFFAFFWVIFLGLFESAIAQVDRRRMRRQNRKVSTFTMQRRFSANKQYLAIGGNIGAGNYFGDLAPNPHIGSFSLTKTRPSFGIHVSKRIHPNISWRGNFGWVRLSGDDFISADPDDISGRYRYLRNAHFRNDVKELSTTLTVDFFGNNGTHLRRRDWNPYVFGGIGIFHHNPRAVAPEGTDQAGRWVALQPLRTEAQGQPGYNRPYSLIQPSIPLGIGIKYRLTDELDLAFEIGYRFLFTDYIDDVSGPMFPNIEDVQPGLARAMAFRSAEENAAAYGRPRDYRRVAESLNLDERTEGGVTYIRGYAGRNQIRGDRNNDYYIVTGFHLTYIITNRARAPKFR
jgi:hypothetical protein